MPNAMQKNSGLLNVRSLSSTDRQVSEAKQQLLALRRPTNFCTKRMCVQTSLK